MMGKTQRFTAIAVVGGKRFEILVPFDPDGKIPRVVTIGVGRHQTKLKKTNKKTNGQWIYREVKSA